MGDADAIREKVLFSSQRVFDSRPARAFLPMIASVGALAVLYSRFRDLFFTEVCTKQGYELLSGQQHGGLRQTAELKRGLVMDRLWQEDGHPLHT